MEEAEILTVTVPAWFSGRVILWQLPMHGACPDVFLPSLDARPDRHLGVARTRTTTKLSRGYGLRSTNLTRNNTRLHVSLKVAVRWKFA